MNADLSWLDQQLRNAEEARSVAIGFTAAIAENEEALRGLWNDACSREMNKRYLAPIGESNANLSDALGEQYDKLRSARSFLESTFQSGGECACISKELEGLSVDARSQEKLIQSLGANIDSWLQDSRGAATEAASCCVRADEEGNSEEDYLSYCD